MSHIPVVFVVDVDISVREALERLISCSGWKARTFASAAEFLACSRDPVPSCLVLECTLPDVDGFELQRRLAERPELPIIFIAEFADVPMTVRAMKAGAHEFLTKPFADEEMQTAVRLAIDVSRAAISRRTEIQALRARYAALSVRERDVMALVLAGLLNRQVGRELGISEITVKVHRGRVMHKMGADSTAALVRMAEKLGVAPAAPRVQLFERTAPPAAVCAAASMPTAAYQSLWATTNAE